MISSPFLARKGARGMVEGVFQHPASGRYLIITVYEIAEK
jgi:hypothetical protein